jgi:accessory gene regulator B
MLLLMCKRFKEGIMFKSCGDKVTSFLVLNKQIDNNDYEIYKYGFKALIAFLVNIAIVIGVGIAFNRLIHSIIFLFCYCLIRQFAGGYHADNNRKRLVIFLCIFIITTLFSKYIYIKSYKEIVALISVISFIGIYILSPVECRNNPLSSKEINKYKKVSRFIAIIVIIYNLIILNNDRLYNYSIYISSALFWIFIMLFLGIIQNSSEGT